MKLRKLLAAGLAAVLTLGTLTGCGNNSGNNQNTNASGGSKDQVQDSGKQEIVNLKWVTIGNGMPSNYDSWIVNVNNYIGEKIGVNLEMVVIPWGDWDKRRNIIINTNEPYDIIFGTGNNYIADINLGAYCDITDMLDTYMPGLKALMPEKYWTGVKVKDRIYGVPTYKDSSISNYAVWDKKIVDDYNINMADYVELESLTGLF